MRARQHPKQSDLFNIQSFNSIRDQLQQQNANLLRERQMIQQQLQSNQSHPYNNNNNSFGAETGKFQHDFSPIHANTSAYNVPSQKNVVGLLKYKISQIIDFCEGQSGSSQFNEVAEAQRQILGFLQTLPNMGLKNVTELSPQKHSRRKKSKLNKTQTYDHKQSFRNILGDEAMELIEQIQRKALLQIENLRNDKISLLKRLNEQIKAHNQQKRIRLIQEKKIKRVSNQRQEEQRNIGMDIVNEQSQSSYSPNKPNQNYERQVENQQPRKKPNQTRNSTNFKPSFNPHSQPQRLNHQYGQQRQPYAPVQNQNQNQNQNHNYSNNHNYLPINSAVSPKNQFNQNLNKNYIPNIPVIPEGSTVQYPPKAPHAGLITQYDQYALPEQRGQYKSPQQIGQHMDRMRQQNQKMRQLLNTNTNNINPNIKNQLRNELAQLQNKIQHYEQAVARSKKGKGPLNFQQFENLMNQANYIAQEGQRILKTKRSLLDNRTTSGSYGFEEAHLSAPLVSNDTKRERTGKFQEINDDQSQYSRPPLQTFSPLDKSYHSHNYKTGSGFSPTAYERLIEEMNSVGKN